MQNKRIKDIGIIILNWRSREVISHCLESIWRAGYIESVVVVDNGSEDGSVEKIKAQISKIKIIKNGQNLGFAGGNNAGIKYALDKGVKYILILNPDTEINKNTIPHLVKVMEKDKRIGICGPKIYASRKKRIIWSAGGILEANRYSGGLMGLGECDKGQYDTAKEVDFISGTAMMVRRDVFEKAGLFHEPYFIYYEDVDLNQKASKAGFKIFYEPQATIVHKESSSMGKNSPAQEYYMARNHLLFVERNASLGVKIREFIRLPKTLYEHIDRKEKYAFIGIRNYFLRRFGKRDYRS